jgi:hypothetical protein
VYVQVLKSAVLTHWESIDVLTRLIDASPLPDPIQAPMQKAQPHARAQLSAYAAAVKQSMALATIIARRDFLRHVVWKRLRNFRLWTQGKNIDDVVAEFEANDREVKHHADNLALHYSRAYQLAYGSPPAAHGAPMNGNTALGTVLTLTAVGNSTFTTRLLLVFFAAVSAVCGFSQNLHEDGSMNVGTAVVHIVANYVMIILPYAILSAFVFREDIFKERGNDTNGQWCSPSAAQAFKIHRT